MGKHYDDRMVENAELILPPEYTFNLTEIIDDDVMHNFHMVTLNYNCFDSKGDLLGSKYRQHQVDAVVDEEAVDTMNRINDSMAQWVADDYFDITGKQGG